VTASPSPSPSPPDGRGLPRLLAVGLLLPTAGTLPVFLLGGLSVQIQDELGFGASGLGAGVATFFGASAAGSAAAGRLVQRVGARGAMVTSGVAAAVILLGIAASARSLPVLLCWLLLGGLCNAFCQPSVNALLARSVPVGRQGLAFAVKQSAIPAATLLGGLAVPALALTVGWRWAYVAGAGLAAVALTLVPRGAAAPADRPSAGTAGDGAGGGRTEGRLEGRPARPPGRVPYRPLLILAAAGGMGAAAGNSIGSFLVSSAVHIGIAESHAGLLLASSSAVVLAVRVSVGLLADRRGSGFFQMVTGLMATGAAGFVLLGSATVPVFVAGAVVAAGAGWGWPGAFNLAVVDHDRSLAAVTTGLTQTGVYLGAVVGPVVFGPVVEHGSFVAAWLVSAGFCLAGAVTVEIGRRHLRNVPASI
jgi:MFS family permease